MRKTLLVMAATALIALFAPPAAVAGGGCRVGPTEAKATRIALAQICFSPTITWIAPGQTVTWVNDDTTTHNVVGPGLTIQSEELLPGKTYTRTFRAIGVYPYSCSLHYGMAGTVVVGTPAPPLVQGDAANPDGSSAVKGPGSSGTTGTGGSGDSVLDSAAAGEVKADATSTGTVATAALIAAGVASLIGFAVGRSRRDARAGVPVTR